MRGLGRALLMLSVLPEMLLSGPPPARAVERLRGPSTDGIDVPPQPTLELSDETELARQRAFAAVRDPRDRSAQRQRRRGRSAAKARRGF